MFSVAQSAKLVGIDEGQLILWLSIKKFVPSVVASLKSTDFAADSLAARALEAYTGKGEQALGWNRFVFTDDDIVRLQIQPHAYAASNLHRERSFLGSGQ